MYCFHIVTGCKMPREDHKASLGPHASVPSSITSADISPHTHLSRRRNKLSMSRMLALNAMQYSTATSRLITEPLDQRCWDLVSLASYCSNIISSRGVNTVCPMNGCNSSMPGKKPSLIHRTDCSHFHPENCNQPQGGRLHLTPGSSLLSSRWSPACWAP